MSARGRQTRNDIQVLCAHGDIVIGFVFLPFQSSDTSKLVTVSKDEHVKIWSIASDSSANSPGISLAQSISLSAEVDCIDAHSNAADCAAVGYGHKVAVVDAQAGRVAIGMRFRPFCMPFWPDSTPFADRIHSVHWSADGRTLLVADKSRTISIVDPRANEMVVNVSCSQSIGLIPQSFASHAGIGRESQAIFLGATGRLLSSGFTARRAQQLLVWDERALQRPLCAQEYAPSTG